MVRTSKFAIIAAMATSLASPALSQSFNKGDGTGNSLPFRYGPGGTKPITVVPENGTAAVPQSGLYNYATIPYAALRPVRRHHRQ